MFHKMPFILFAVIALAALSNSYLPESIQSIFFALSLSLKSLIIFVLPFLVFGLIFKTASKASVLLILVAICASNFFSTMLSYCVGASAYHLDLSLSLPNESLSLLPAWDFSFPKWIGNGQAMLSGFILGIILGRYKPLLAAKISSHLDRIINVMLKGFLFIIPLFIAGFIIKMGHDQILSHILQSYALIFAIIASAVFTYIALIYYFCSHHFLPSLKNMLPAAITGFGSMSSAAAMPLTILGTEKNSPNPLAKSIIPVTVNIHLIGDCFAIPIFAFAVLKSFGIAEPPFLAYLAFAAYFVLAKFSVAAVPGGGILVMLPILESCLGFTAEMLSLITALYVLFDPVITCANVLGNGGFAMAMGRIFTNFKTLKIT